MTEVDYTETFQSILSGKQPGSELVIGLVGAVGVDLDSIAQDLSECLKKYKYSTDLFQVSDLIGTLTAIPDYDKGSEFERTNAYMTAGDSARESSGENAILALAVANQINGERETEEIPGTSMRKALPRSRRAYIIKSLKHPDEVNALRRIYANSFFLLGVYVEHKRRKLRLVRSKKMLDTEADMLMARDDSEGSVYGQRTRDTFHLSDFFVQLLDENDTEVEKTKSRLERFLDIVFADPYRTPLFDEHAMFMAFAAATRSADLSRQVGAIIARDDEILASGANDCPRAGGGTYWPFLDDVDRVIDVEGGRDYTLGRDRNDEEKARIIEDAIGEMKRAWGHEGKPDVSCEDWESLRKALETSTIDDITEYGRAVHAEMDALMSCARNSISCRGATLYSTAYPCHNCAKHIIAAGIKRVVYVEPYPKSKALEFHTDSAFAGFDGTRPEGDNRVVFEHFVGIGPRRFFDLFSMTQGSGFPIKRKDKNSGKTLKWEAESGIMRTPELPWSYLQREEIATKIHAKHWKGVGNVQQEKDSGEQGRTDARENTRSDSEGV